MADNEKWLGNRYHLEEESDFWITKGDLLEKATRALDLRIHSVMEDLKCKAETTEDLNEWKAALEEALPDAPTASQTVGLLRRKDYQSQRPYRGVVAVYQLLNHFE
ncbi:hypothetical protein Tco_1397507 [Tanacetum coccineum]